METILVVEDESSLRENIQETLELSNYRILTADNGFAALEIVKTELPDLVVSDIMMPGMDGYQILEEFQKNPRTSTIPFIFLTAKSGETDIRKGMNGGADDYLTKPFKVKDLLQAVATRLKKKQRVDIILTETTKSISQYVPHELRTPLVSILGFTQILIEENEKINKEELLDYLAKIKKASTKLYKTIEKFLLYSELSLPKDDIPDDSDYLYTIVNEDEISQFLYKSMFNYNREEDIKVHLEQTGLKISKKHFLRILEEIADNALKFSPSGTEVKISGYNENEKYKVEVIDFGKGMPEEQAAEFFPFIQHERNITGQDGNGLGLPIVCKLMDIYGGKIEIESKENKFTRVLLIFPQAGK